MKNAVYTLLLLASVTVAFLAGSWSGPQGTVGAATPAACPPAPRSPPVTRIDAASAQGVRRPFRGQAECYYSRRRRRIRRPAGPPATAGSIAFTLISNFTNLVEIPADHVPTRREDLKEVVVGSPVSPLEIYMVHRLGDEFWLRHGVVQQYQSPESFHHKDLRTMRTKYLGPPTLSTNEVVERATHLMRKLTKTGRSVDMVVPKIEAAWSPDVHFFEISWPITNSPYRNGLGSIEIDARTGRIVFLQLWGQGFYDYATAAEISKRVGFIHKDRGLIIHT